MAAQTFTATRAASTQPIPQILNGLTPLWGTFTLTEVPEVGDIYQLCRAPKGFTPLFGYFAATDIDTGTETLDMDLGIAANGTDAADPDYFVNGGVFTGDAITDLPWTNSANVRFFTPTIPTTFAGRLRRKKKCRADRKVLARSGAYF